MATIKEDHKTDHKIITESDQALTMPDRPHGFSRIATTVSVAILATLGFSSASFSPRGSPKGDEGGEQSNSLTSDPVMDASVATLIHTKSWFNASSAPTAEDLNGRVVVGYFWATWCGPCRGSFPWLNELQNKYGDSVIILALSDESADVVAPIAMPASAEDSPIFMIGAESRTAHKSFEVKALPTIVVFGRDGQLHERQVGAGLKSHQAIESAIETELAKAPSDPKQTTHSVRASGQVVGSAQMALNSLIEQRKNSKGFDLTSLHTFADQISNLKVGQKVDIDMVKKLSNFYLENSSDEPSSVAVRAQALKLLGRSYRQGSDEAKSHLRSFLADLLAVPDSDVTVRRSLADAVGSMFSKESDSGIKNDFSDRLKQVAARESDPLAGATFASVARGLVATSFTVQEWPSLLMSLRDRPRDPSAIEKQFTLAVQEKSLTIEALKLFHAKATEIPLRDGAGNISRDALRARDQFLATIEALADQHNPELSACAQQAVAEILLKDSGADWMLDYLCLYRLSELGTSYLTPAMRAEITSRLPALIKSENATMSWAADIVNRSLSPNERQVTRKTAP